MLRRFLATKAGLAIVLIAEAVLLLIVLPRILPDSGLAWYGVLFWVIATVLYFTNHRAWRWLQRSN